MVRIAGIQFQKNGKIYQYDANNLEVAPGDYVVADTSRGYDLGQVITGIREMEENACPPQLRKIIRLATEQDLARATENRQKEREAYEVCQKKISEHNLDMKLVSVEYAFDGSKALFYFTANGRVDFRALVKDLASAFKMRIELRQIGVRDEARMLGGLGPCGRPICCGAFLEEFQPVSIKMAKEQNLSLNPTKISGVCGRLMCCLKYEQDHYEQTRKKMPRIGREVMTPDGKGTVSDLNIVKETVSVRIVNGDSSEIKEYPMEKVERIGGGPNCPCPRMQEPEEFEETAEIEEEMTEKEPAEERSEERRMPARENRNGKNGRGRNGARGKEPRKNEKGEDRNERQLGKPVMRENPNRNQNAAAQSPANQTPAQNAPVSGPAQSAAAPTAPVPTPSPAPVQSAPAPSAAQERKEPEKPPEAKPGKTSWAEAVKKAMDGLS